LENKTPGKTISLVEDKNMNSHSKTLGQSSA